jgi:hypothetical protein
LLQGLKIPPFGDLYKRIRLADFRQRRTQEQRATMRFHKKKSAHQGTTKFQGILPLVPPKISAEDLKDKTKFVTFDLKVRAGGNAASPSYKKSMKTFDEGGPQEWIDVLQGLKEIWLQNSVTGPTDRAATVMAILKGDSRSNFETALEDARMHPGGGAPLVMTNNMIDTSLLAVTNVVFPFRALELQKQWMNRSMKKPYDLSARSTKNAIARLNNTLPLFPLGTEASKFSDAELIGLFEFSLPQRWRNIMDAKGFVPSLGTMAELVTECECIERTEAVSSGQTEDDRKNKFTKSENSNKKSENKNSGKRTDRKTEKFYCKECGRNDTHNTDRCYILKRLAREDNTSNGKAHAGPKPFSKRTFRKEINALVRRAGKHDGLDLFTQAIKREQKKESKRSSKTSKHSSSKSKAKASAKEDSSSSSEEESDGSVHIMDMEKPIPRKKASATIRIATRTFNRVPKKNIFEDLMDTISSDEEIEVMADNKPTAEEKAFLKSIDKEERKLASKKTNSSGEETD